MKLKTLVFLFLIFGSFNSLNAQEKASTILENAFAQAKKENKKVFVMYHASWCKWCKLMEDKMKLKPIKPIFDANYVMAFLTVNESKDKKNLENPGALEILKQAKAENSGIPFWQIYDADGKVLTDAFNSKGENLGCPSTQEEAIEFAHKLKETSNISEIDRRKITDVFTDKKK